MKPYPAYKDSGIEWIGEIPEHWEIKKLKHLFEFLDYKRIPLSAEVRGDMEKIYDYYGASGVIDKVEDYLFDETLILVGEDGANLLSRSTPLAFLAKGKYWVNNHAHILKPKYGDINYFVNLLESIDYTTRISGSAQPKLTAENLGDVFTIKPPFSEQQSITAYLDYKTSQLDTLIEKKQKQIELLKEERTAIINQAVTKGLNPDVPMKDSGIEWMGEVPQHWDVTFLKHICAKITDGSHFSPETQDSGVPYITVQDVKDNFIDFENSKRISEIDYLNLKRNGCQPMEGDVLLTKDGTIGRAVVVESEEKFAILSSLGLIRPSKVKVIPDYLRYYLISGLNIDQMFSFIRGSALTRLTIKLIEQLIIVYPSIQEQQSIVVHLNQKTFQIDNIIKNIQKQLILLQEYRTALISNAVTGKIDIRDYHGNSTESNM